MATVEVVITVVLFYQFTALLEQLLSALYL